MMNKKGVFTPFLFDERDLPFLNQSYLGFLKENPGQKLLLMNFISKLKNLLFPLGNSEFVTIMMCRSLGVHVTDTAIKKQLEEHPNFPTLLSVSETLGSFGVENLATKVSFHQLSQLPAPMIVQLSMDRELYFTVVNAVSPENVTYIDPKDKRVVNTPLSSFSALFTGYVLLAEASDKAGEKEFRKNLREEYRKKIAKLASAFIIPLFTFFFCGWALTTQGTAAIPAVIYSLLTLVGSIAGVLLLWYEIDQHNPALKEICSAGKKTNCNAILTSGASKIFGISWSVIGFTYFGGSLFCILAAGIYQQPVLSLLSWMNIMALPYIAFSLYYQAKIAKQWCTLCITVQCILFLQFAVALWGGFHSLDYLSLIGRSVMLEVAISFVIPFIIVSLLLPALRKAKESRSNKMELQRLKHDSRVFDAVLEKQRRVQVPGGLGITIGNPNAKHKLLKVCNPYCGPCAKAHPTMEALIDDNPDLQIQILFTATGMDDDFKTPPVRHLLAIAEKGNDRLTRQALDDWYLADVKSYSQFAVKYPMNGELKQQTEKMKAMDDWCNEVNIESTPTFFFNNHQLPKFYSVADLKYFLSV